MPQRLTLKDGTGHPYPNGRRWFYFTVLLSVLVLPSLVIFNVITQGSELVPSLQPTFDSDNNSPDRGLHHLPEGLRPSLPQCQPQSLGRGDTFRLSASLFDYTVLSTWNTTKTPSMEKVQKAEHVAYRGESFANCSASSARYDFSLSDQIHSVTIGVDCPGYDRYPIKISMQTTMTFAWDFTKDFIGQYYGTSLDLLDHIDTFNYRKNVLALLEVISTDALTIFQRRHLPVHPLGLTAYFDHISDDNLLPDRTLTTTLTYLNGSQSMGYPKGAFIYTDTIYNLVYVAIDAVNLDLGNNKPNLFRNSTRFPEVIWSNRAPPEINATEWALGTQSFYYGTIAPPYQTWAEMLRMEPPSNITFGDVQRLPDDSVMVTSYLCPVYQIKPLKSLLSSVFIGSAAMSSSAWSLWFLLVALLAKGQAEPRGQCECSDCMYRRERYEQEKAKRKARRMGRRKAKRKAMVGVVGRLLARFRNPKPTSNSGDLEQAALPSLSHRPASDQSDALVEKSKRT